MRAGLLGEKLGHSYSPQIHALLGDYSYELFAVAPDALDAFLKSDAFDALNVTIPYKKSVIPYCAELTETARAIGSVNTIVRRKDGTLLGDNTDAAGFAGMVRRLGVDPRGKKALVLGSGGASLAVVHELRALGADPVIVISRSGEDNYQNLDRHADAALLANATPLGMYPENGRAAVDISRFPHLEAVYDLVYNPLRTRLILDADAHGIPAVSGLYMLVEQARKASERFTGRTIPAQKTDLIYRQLRAQAENIILIGMPGCGKSTLGMLLAAKLGRPFADADALLCERFSTSIPEYFARHDEDAFRTEETKVLAELGKLSGQVIATGGGCVTRPENRDLLWQNGEVFFIRRSIEQLPTEGRPLSQAGSLNDMYAHRLPLYRHFAHAEIENNGTPEETVRAIEEAYDETVGC